MESSWLVKLAPPGVIGAWRNPETHLPADFDLHRDVRSR
jgi:hypothetical protein